MGIFKLKNKEHESLDDKEAGRRYKARRAAAAEKLAVNGVSQHAFLRQFYVQASEVTEVAGRIALLRYVAENIRFSVIDRRTLQKRRRAFDSNKNAKFPLEGALCWACGKDKHIIRHHVIPLQNGGGPQVVKNVVMLCEYCHADVHPWLSYPAQPVEAAEFKLAQAKVDVIQILERAARGKYAIFDTAEREIVDCLRSIFNNLA